MAENHAAPGTQITSRKVLNLQQCVDWALQNNPTIRIGQKSVERAKAMQGTAWDVDKTELSLSQDPTSGGSPDNAIAITQQIEFPTVYAARHRQFKAEMKAEMSRMDVLRNQLKADVTSAYYSVIYNQERVRILQQQDSLLVHYLDIATKRHQAGEVRKLEVLSAERMHNENYLELASAKTEVGTSLLQLANLLNTDEVIVPAEESLKAIQSKVSAYNYQQTSEGVYAQDRLTALDKSLATAKTGYAPSLSLSLRNQLVITSWDPYHQSRSKFDGGNFMGFEVGIGVPLFFGATKAKVKAARVEREMAEMEMNQQQASRNKEYETIRNRYSAAYSRMMYYEQKGMKSASEREKLGTLEYENGEIDYTDYVVILQECIDTKLKYASALNDYNQAVIEMQRLVGHE